MLLSEVAATSAVVARTPARLAKIEAIAGLLGRVPPDEVRIATAFLSGELTQRQIGVGYAALVGLPEAGESGSDDSSGAVLAEAGAEEPAGFTAEGELAAAVAEAGAGSGPAAQPSLTLTEADEAFERIGRLTGPGSQAARRELLAGVLGRTTGDERRFLIRLLAGDLRQGALEGVMIEAVAKAAGVPAAEVRRAHQLRGSLPEVAQAALGAAAAPGQEDRKSAVTAVLRSFTLRVGQPVRPMLAASAPDLDAALDRISPAVLEWKIDGVRIQVHKDGEQVRVFTRTLDDITGRVPEIAAMARSLTVGSAVIDGEAVALRSDGRPHPFQVTSARAASQQGAPSAPARRSGGRLTDVTLTAFLFDLLHVDGQDLLERPASERFGHLEQIAPAGTLIPHLVTGDRDQAAGFFAEALGHGHEGVVVKAPDSTYGAGRRGSDWIKVKPRTTLDLVILAAEWGHGRRTGWLSNLHLGARDPDGGGFVMLGKTFKGLTDAMLAWQTERLLELADPPQQAGLEFRASDSGDDARGWRYGVVRVRPELVAEIAFDGVQASRRYPGGVTLRFARVLRYREDKPAGEADTLETVRALWPHDSGDEG
ncbi:MAG TPA: ATP-dependent DNA ligase [Streptosporangiaceae bacterium]